MYTLTVDTVVGLPSEMHQSTPYPPAMRTSIFHRRWANVSQYLQREAFHIPCV